MAEEEEQQTRRRGRGRGGRGHGKTKATAKAKPVLCFCFSCTEQVKPDDMWCRRHCNLCVRFRLRAAADGGDAEETCEEILKDSVRAEQPWMVSKRPSRMAG